MLGLLPIEAVSTGRGRDRIPGLFDNDFPSSRRICQENPVGWFGLLGMKEPDARVDGNPENTVGGYVDFAPGDVLMTMFGWP